MNLLARELEARVDAVTHARSIGIEPDPWQADILRSIAPRLWINACRQSGKSTTVAILNVHTALYQPKSLCLMLSPSLRQSGELFKKAAEVYRALGRPVRPDSETALTVTLENGSRIVSLPGSEGTIRGYSGVRLLSIDEAAKVPLALYAAVRPMLAVSRGRLIVMSTPYGARGWWYEAGRDTGQAWERYEVPWTQCPRITADFVEEERRAMGDWWVQQEYGCLFLDAQTSAFASVDIEAAFSEEV